MKVYNNLAQYLAEYAYAAAVMKGMGRPDEMRDIERAFQEGRTYWTAHYLPPAQAPLYKDALERVGFAVELTAPREDEEQPGNWLVSAVVTVPEATEEVERCGTCQAPLQPPYDMEGYCPACTQKMSMADGAREYLKLLLAQLAERFAAAYEGTGAVQAIQSDFGGMLEEAFAGHVR